MHLLFSEGNLFTLGRLPPKKNSASIGGINMKMASSHEIFNKFDSQNVSNEEISTAFSVV